MFLDPYRLCPHADQDRHCFIHIYQDPLQAILILVFQDIHTCFPFEKKWSYSIPSFSFQDSHTRSSFEEEEEKKKGFAIPSFRAGGGIPAINYSHGTGSPYFLSRYGNGKLPRSLALSVFVHVDPVPALFYRFIPFLVAKWWKNTINLYFLYHFIEIWCQEFIHFSSFHFMIPFSSRTIYEPSIVLFTRIRTLSFLPHPLHTVPDPSLMLSNRRGSSLHPSLPRFRIPKHPAILPW